MMEIIINPKKEVKSLSLEELEYFVKALDLFMGEKTRLDECLCSITGSNVLSDIGGGIMDRYGELIDRLNGKELNDFNNFMTFYLERYDGQNLQEYLNN